MVSSVIFSVVILTKDTFLEVIGKDSSRQVTVLVCSPPPHDLEHSVHSLTFHLNSVRGLSIKFVKLSLRISMHT